MPTKGSSIIQKAPRGSGIDSHDRRSAEKGGKGLTARGANENRRSNDNYSRPIEIYESAERRYAKAMSRLAK